METNGDQTTNLTQPNTDQTANLTRFTVAQAADALGLSAEAVRMRIKRGTLAHGKEENTVYVLLEPSSLETDQTRPNSERTQPNNDQLADQTTDQTSQMVETLQAEVQFLRQELKLSRELREEEARRKDAIIMTMAQRIPELEPASEAPESPETAAAGAEGVEVPISEQKSSWLKRFFGF